MRAISPAAIGGVVSVALNERMAVGLAIACWPEVHGACCPDCVGSVKRGTLWHRKAIPMSWSVRVGVLLVLVLVVVLVLAACGVGSMAHESDAGAHSTAGMSSMSSMSGSGGSAGGGGSAGSATLLHEPAHHRTAEVSCGTPPASAPKASAPASGAPLPTQFCSVDADCTAGNNGRCERSNFGMQCVYDRCFVDADCDSGSVCICSAPGGFGNHCGQVGCRLDADCPGSWCSPTFSSCGEYSGVVGYACHTRQDECVDDTDCKDPSMLSTPYCMYDPAVAHWICSTSRCAG